MYPVKEQLLLLEETLGLHCRVYNTLLVEHKLRYDSGLAGYTYIRMAKDITSWRADVPAVKAINAQSLQNTAKRVDRAFQAFFRRAKAGDEPGYPRFKSAKRYPGWGYNTHGDGWRFFEGQKSSHNLRLSGVGNIKLRGRGRFTGNPKTAEVIHKNSKWYLSVTFQVDPKQLARPAGTESAAFDWGLKQLLTIAKGDGSVEEIGNSRFLKNSLAALKQLQQAVSVEEIKAKNRIGFSADQAIPKGIRLPISVKMKRLYRQIGTLHGKVARQRHDFYHKLANLLISRFGFLASEELNVKSMVKRPKAIKDTENGEFAPNGANRKAKLNRSIHDAAPAMLLQIIRTKAEEAGSWFSLANTKVVKPTQRCHVCGTLVPKELDERWHTCPECYTHCGRDENAARTLLRWLNEGYYWLGTGQADSRQQETPSKLLAA